MLSLWRLIVMLPIYRLIARTLYNNKTCGTKGPRRNVKYSLSLEMIQTANVRCGATIERMHTMKLYKLQPQNHKPSIAHELDNVCDVSYILFP